MRDLEFDRVGTPSAELPDQVSDAVKETRRNALMELQQGISLKKNQALIGRTIPVLVEGELPVGQIVPVRVTGATTYDLIATPDVQGPIVIQPGRVYGEGAIPLDGIG